MAVEYVILVNNDDKPLGTMEKMEAHEKAALHRAFSVFIFNTQGQLLLQQRASHKYHSPLLLPTRRVEPIITHPNPPGFYQPVGFDYG